MKTSDVVKLTSYLSFRLNDEVFAINVGSVLSILELPKITKIPKAPSYLRGIINLRGEVLPVIDIHNKFGMPEAQITSSTCILVMEAIVEGQYIKFGILVDSVNEVHEIEPEKILPTPTLGDNYKADFLEGIYQTGESFIMLIIVERLVEGNEIAMLKNSTNDLVPEEIS